MTACRSHRGGRLGLLVLACLLFAVLVTAVEHDWADAAGEPGRLVAEPVLKSAAAGAERLFGASPQESSGEVWGGGFSDGIVRYTSAGGWEKVAPPVDSNGQPLTSYQIAEGALAGRTTPAGGVAVAITATTEAGSRQALAVRNPGGSFRTTPEPGAALLPEESLFASGTGNLLMAPVEEGGETGVFLVPPKLAAKPQAAVLHYAAGAWTREPICLEATCKEPPKELPSNFKVLAIDASGPENAWLLGRNPTAKEPIVLLHREEGQWRQQPLGVGLGSLFSRETVEASPGARITVAARSQGQPLTVTSAGVWIDATLTARSEAGDATIYYAIESHQMSHSWCNEPPIGATPLCESPLGSELPAGESRSFAWAGGEYGQRVITGVGQGGLLVFSGSGFQRVTLAGGNVGTSFGAALSGLEEGWLGSSTGPLRLTREPTPAALQAWPLPFRRPLTAIAPAPDQPVGSLSSEALAVGDQGQVARYIPGQGWVAESLFSSLGVRATPRLRAVAWPVPGFAYAVGDGGAMWMWRAASGLWEPDPGSPPNLVRGNFTDIAFDPANPDRGYAVGKQGLLLGYGLEWTQEALPAGVNPEVNFTSVAFAGEEAIAAYCFPLERGGAYEGGLLVDEGSGWRIEPGLTGHGAPVLVAGLPDGGAVVAYQDGTVAERESAGSPWVPTPENAGGYPVALAAVREAGQVRAVISIEPGSEGQGWNSDKEQVYDQPAAGEPPLLTKPYPLPWRGYLERQTATGWRDEQHEALPVPTGTNPTDLPREPDPLLAMLIAPEGSTGWVVGGETGERVKSEGKAVQTATVMRYGPGAAPPANFTSVPIPPSTGVSVAIGGNAHCANACADQVGTGIGPEEWLPAAVREAGSIGGIGAFVYTGPGVALGQEESGGGPSTRLGATLSRGAFTREEDAYARRLGAGAGSLPVYPAPASSDLDKANSLATFAEAFQGVTPVPTTELDSGYYSFNAGPIGQGMKVVVLNYSAPTLTGQSCWLAQQLEAAKKEGEPAIVVGNRDLGGRAPTYAQASNPAEVIQILVTGTTPALTAAKCVTEPAAASGYFFDFPEENRTYQLTFGGSSIPAFGSGTLGYIVPSEVSTDFLGASGFLLVSIAGTRNLVTNVAPLQVRLIPSVGELALEAVDGTLLRRSSPALFRGLARRPRGGAFCAGPQPGTACEQLRPNPYQPIPATCVGGNCSSGLFPEYSFRSSNPDIANFVEVDPSAQNPRAVLLGSDGKPIPDPTSGLLCAFNAGTTTVTLEAGGYAYSTTVTVQQGSVQRPCGTVPLSNPPQPLQQPALPPVKFPESPTSPNFTGPDILPPPPVPAPVPVANPVPLAPHPLPLPHAPASSLSFFPIQSPGLVPVVPIVPPPPAPTVEPTPPSGTSPVTQPAVSPEPEEEEEAAFDLVHHMAAYRHERARDAAATVAPSATGGASSLRYFLPALVLLLALAAAGAAKPRRRSSRLAYETRATPRRPSR